LDSGAVYSCISGDFFNTIENTNSLINYTGVPFKVASNETMMLEGIAEVGSSIHSL
jgi:hypothetical protein